MTELAFLLDLLLEHKLSATTRKAITERIKFVEQRLSQGAAPVIARPAALPVPAVLPPHMVGQSASTIQAMLRHEANGAAAPSVPLAQPDAAIAAAAIPTPQSVIAIAQTPQAAAAVAARQQSLAIGISGKPAKGETSPRKW